MSGPTCPDCGYGFIGPGDSPDTDQCGFCFWVGPCQPNIEFAEAETEEGIINEFQAKETARNEGKLFFMRFWFEDGLDREKSNEVRNAVEVLFDPRANVGLGKVPYTELETMPSDDIIDKIRAIEGISKVEVR